MFGDRGFLDLPTPVPTLRYVRTNNRGVVGEFIDSPYLAGVVKNVVVRAGADRLVQWSIESRHVVDDYIAAFGEPPNDHIHAVVLFTDNDQTSEPVVAYYEWTKLTCMNE